MKKYIITTLMLVFSMGVFAEKADTIMVNSNNITKVIEDKTVNTKGKTVIKYYFIYNDELIPTSKTVIDKYNLCKKYNAKIALAMIVRKTSKRIISN